MEVNTEHPDFSVIKEELIFWQQSTFLHPFICEENKEHGKLKVSVLNDTLILKCPFCDFFQSQIPEEITDQFWRKKIHEAEEKRNLFLETMDLPVEYKPTIGDTVLLVGNRKAIITGLGEDAFFIQTEDGEGPLIIFEWDIIQIIQKNNQSTTHHLNPHGF